MSQQADVSYHVTVDPDRRELLIKARFKGAFAAGESLIVETPSWVPGNYNFMQFARDVFCLEASDTATGEALAWRREGWNGFRILAPGGDVTLRYRAYAFEPDFGEPAGILDNGYAALLGTRYLYCKGHLGPCQVSYALPGLWQGRLHHPSGALRIDPTTFLYPSYEILLDTPVVMGDFTLVRRVVGDTPIYFAFVDRAAGFEAKVERWVDDVAKVAGFFLDMFGSFPFSDYTFVLSCNPRNEWGLEHLTSTMCGIGPDVFVDEDQFKIGVRVCAHEMFHAWIVRRLRPAPLLQLQHHLDTGSFSEGLWLAEGFTRYYEFLACTVTGIYSPEAFLSNIVGYFGHLTQIPAYDRVSVTDSSLATYLNHHPKYPGRVNNSIDYYDKGMLIAFGLDASLRLDARGGDLNQALSAFYRRNVHWPNPEPDQLGFTTQDVLDHFEASLPGLGAKLDREVNHPGGLDTEALLTRLGFEVVRQPVFTLGLVFTDDSATIYNLLDDAPAGQSGLAPGDVIATVNGFAWSADALRAAVDQGQAVTLMVLRGHRMLQFSVVPLAREAIAQLIWRGDAARRQRLFAWFGRSFDLSDGRAIPLDFYENFHGVEMVV